MTSQSADMISSVSRASGLSLARSSWSRLIPELRGWVFVIVCAALVGGIGYKKPTHDWDMIAYVASALRDDGLRGEALRSATYAEVRADVNDDEWAKLVGQDPIATGQQIADYRATVARDPAALESQLPFYRVKLLYMSLVKGAHRLGLSYVKASYAVSAAFGAMLVVAFGLLLMRLRLPLLLLPVGITAANICAFNNVAFGSLASQSTPDAVSCFCAFICLWLASRRDGLGLAAAALAPIARPDFIILSAALVAAILYSRRDVLRLSDFPRFPAEARRLLIGGALSLGGAAAIYLARTISSAPIPSRPCSTIPSWASRPMSTR